MLPLAVIAAWVALVLATPIGVSVTPDSVAYRDAAESLIAGAGLTVYSPCAAIPLVHFPPGLPVLLAIPMRFGASPLLASALVNGAAWALILVLAARLSRARALLPILVASPVMLELMTALWSEPAAIALTLAAFALVVRGLEGGPRWCFAAAGLVVGFAFSVRYASAAAVAAIGLVVLLRAPRRLAELSAAALLPMLAVLVRNHVVSGRALNRTPRWGGLGFEHLRALAQTVGAWVVPGTDRVSLLPAQDGLTGILAALVFAALVVATLRLRRAEGRVPARFVLLASFVALHVLMLLLTVGVVSQRVGFDARLMSPAYVAAAIYTAAMWPRGRARPLAALLVLGHLAAGVYVVQHLHRHPRGYLAERWRSPAVEAALATLPEGSVVVSNVPEAVHFRTGRLACAAPAFEADHPSAKLLERKLAVGEVVVALYHGERQLPPRARAASPLLDEQRGRAARLLIEERGFTLMVEDERAALYVPASSP